MNTMIQRGVTASLKSKVVWTNRAASVTSHSCQDWGMSSPWHLSNPSYLKLSPPAPRWLISPDTSQCPDRESLYPENNPALLPLNPKSVPAAFFSCLSSLYFSLPSSSLSMPPSLHLSVAYYFPCVSICLCQTIFCSSSVSLNLSSPCFSAPSSPPCRVNHASVDEDLWKAGVIAHWEIACISLRTYWYSEVHFTPLVYALYLLVHLYRWGDAPEDHFGKVQREHKHRHLSPDTHHPNIVQLLEWKERWETCGYVSFFNVCTERLLFRFLFKTQ